MTVKKPVETIWRSLPNGKLKQGAREVLANLEYRGKARFHREDTTYVVETPRFTVRSAEPIYGLLNLLGQFEGRHQVQPGEFVMDAGAFNGILTNVFAKVAGPNGKVISFEPDHMSQPRVLRNLALNGNPENVELIKKGLWDSEGEIGFCERGALGSSVFWEGEGGHKTVIPTTTIDAVVAARNLPRLDFIKMNIEGSELRALHGASKTIARFKPHFAISSDHLIDEQTTSARVEAILREHGYRAETVTYQIETVTYGTPPS